MASGSRIKGITIQIGGDTQGLDKALKDVNKNIRNTQSELKDVTRLLKLDPTNTELMAQKQRLLTQAVNETKEKLETLKEAGQQANEALARGDISQNQYDALQREIIETENELRGLETQAEQSSVALQKISATGEKLKDVGSAIENAGKKMMVVTTAVTALGTAAVKVTSDFDSAMSKVAAVSGAAGDELQALRDKAREMGETTKFSAAEAAEAMNYMAMAGWKTGDMLSGIEGIMNLAAASGEDLATTSDIVTDALSAFGLTAADSAHFADILAAASANANTNVSMMGESFKYCAPVAGALGFTAEETAEAIGLMANAGIKADQGGTAMRSMMLNLSSAVKLTGSQIGEMTIQTTSSTGSMKSLNQILKELRRAFSQMSESERAANAEALVGKNAVSGFLALMNAAPEDIEKVRQAIAGCDGASKDMADTMQDNLEGQITILKSQLQELAISFGEILMPAIRAIVSGIQGLVDWLNKLDPTVKKIVTVIALIVAAIGPILIIVGKLIIFAGQIMTFLPKVIGLIKVISGVISAIIPVITSIVAAVGIVPILIGAAIAAVIAVVVTLYNKCEWFRDAVNLIWEKVSQFFIKAWNGIIKFFTETIPAAWDSLVAFFQGIPEWWSQLWEQVSEFFVGIWQNIIGFFTETIPAAWDSVVAFFQGIPEWWSQLWTDICNIFTELWGGLLENPVISSIVDTLVQLWENAVSTIEGIWNGLKEIAAGVWELIKNVVLGPVLLLIDLVTGDFEALKNDAQKIWENIKEAASKIWEGLKKTVVSIVKGFVDRVGTLINGFKNTVSIIWDGIKQFAIETWQALKDEVVSIAKGIVDGIIQFFTTLPDKIRQLWETIKQNAFDAWENIKNKVLETARNLKDSAIQAFKDLVTGIKDALKSLGEKVEEGFQAAIDFITSLPEKAIEWGKDFINGLKEGIEQKIKDIVESVKKVAQKIRELLHFSRPDKGPLRDYEKWMPDFMQGLADGIRNNQHLVTDAVKGLSANMTIATEGISLKGEGYSISGINDMCKLMQQYLPYLAAGTSMRLETGELVGVLAPSLNSEFGKIAIREAQR